MADVAVPTSEINLPSLLTRHDNSQSTMGQAPETWVVPDFNIPILSSMIKLTFPLLTYIGWDYNFHFYSTEYQLNLSILRTARSWLFAVTFMFSIFYSKKKLSSPVFIGVVIMRLRVFIMRVHIKACVRVLKCSMKIYNPQTPHIIFEQNTGTAILRYFKSKIYFVWGSKKPKILTFNRFNIQFYFPTLYNSKLVEIGHGENFPKKVSKFYQNNPTLKMPLNMEIIYI